MTQDTGFVCMAGTHFDNQKFGKEMPGWGRTGGFVPAFAVSESYFTPYIPAT